MNETTNTNPTVSSLKPHRMEATGRKTEHCRRKIEIQYPNAIGHTQQRKGSDKVSVLASALATRILRSYWADTSQLGVDTTNAKDPRSWMNKKDNHFFRSQLKKILKHELANAMAIDQAFGQV